MSSPDFVGKSFDFEISYRFTDIVLSFKAGQEFYDKYLDYNSETYNHFQYLVGFYNQYSFSNFIYSFGISMNEGQYLIEDYYPYEDLSEEDLFDWFSEYKDHHFYSLLIEFKYNIELNSNIHLGAIIKLNMHLKRLSVISLITVSHLFGN